MASYTSSYHKTRVAYQDAPALVLEEPLRLRLRETSIPKLNFAAIYDKAASAADVEDKIKKGEDLTEEERKRFNEVSRAEIHSIFDASRDRVADLCTLQVNDTIEERRIKIEIKASFLGWLKQLLDWVFEKLEALIKRIQEGVTKICKEIKDLFLYLSSLFKF